MIGLPHLPVSDLVAVTFSFLCHLFIPGGCHLFIPSGSPQNPSGSPQNGWFWRAHRWLVLRARSQYGRNRVRRHQMPPNHSVIASFQGEAMSLNASHTPELFKDKDG